MESILVTGGAGFIGSHLVRRLVTKYQDRYHVVNLDKLTYAGNIANVSDLRGSGNHEFVRGDILDREMLASLFQRHQFKGIFHLAAESHVDRSIHSPATFVETNVLGTVNLLDAAREIWKDRSDCCFCMVSTDEVYGSLGEEGAFTESTPYDPRSPYAASKAAADHLVRAYYNTFDLPIKLTNCSNNYGSHQFPEKLIPVCISRLIAQEPIPVYGKGENVRDWLHVEDHARALDLVFHSGGVGESYNIGGGCEVRNIDLVKILCRLSDLALKRKPGTGEKLISFVEDRPGHDYRYAVDFSKLSGQLNWQPETKINDGLSDTLHWYLKNQEWMEDIRSGKYRKQEVS